MRDRTVHGWSPNGGEVVRYDRAGKWYVEYPDGRPRKALALAEAVELVLAEGGVPALGRPGGTRFDAAVRAAA